MTHQRFVRGSLFCLVLILLLTTTLFVSNASRRSRTPAGSLPSELDVRVPGGVLSRNGRAVSLKDTKGARRLAARAPDASQAKALNSLQREAGSPVRAEHNHLTGTPRHMLATEGYLTKPSADAPEKVALDFVRRWQGVFGVGDEDVAALRLRSRATPRDIGATILLYEQQVEGVPVYKGEVMVNVNRAGQVMSVGGDSYPQLKVTNSVALSPSGAVSAAAASLGFEGFA